MKRHSTRFNIGVAALGAALSLGSAGLAFAAPADEPAGPFAQNRRVAGLEPDKLPKELRTGAGLFAAKCTQCHTLRRAINKSDSSSEEWSDIIFRMSHMASAHLKEDEAKAILEYVVWNCKHSKPGAQGTR